jgi:aminopeptidase N
MHSSSQSNPQTKPSMNDRLEDNDNNPDHKTIYLKDYQQPNFWVENVKLNVNLNDEHTRVTSKIDFFRNKQLGDNTPLILQGDALKLVEIKLNSK